MKNISSKSPLQHLFLSAVTESWFFNPFNNFNQNNVKTIKINFKEYIHYLLIHSLMLFMKLVT